MRVSDIGRQTRAVALIILMLSIPLYAQEKKGEEDPGATAPAQGELPLETIEVTGTAGDGDTQDIEHSKLRLRNFVDLSEALAHEIVEVQLIRKSGYGNEVSVRGFGQENIRVLLDGGILEGACGSRKDPSLSLVNMLTVQKLTVMEGPFDVTKPGCLGGYVNVVTRKPGPDFEGEILAKAGSFGFLNGGGTVSGGNAKIQGLIGYSYSESGQYADGSGDRLWTVREGLAAPYNDAGREAKAFQKHDVWGKLQFEPGKDHSILLEHDYGRANGIVTPRVVFDTDREITNLSRASWVVRDLGKLSKRLSVSFFRNEVGHYPFQGFRSVPKPKNNQVESVITGGAVQNETTTGRSTWVYGIGLYHRDWWGDVYDSLTGVKINDNLIPSVRTTNLGGYLQWSRPFEKWSVELAVRYDHFEQEAHEELVFSKAVTPENRRVNNLFGGYLLARYFPSEHTMFSFGAGRSYRTPVSTERYIQGGPSFFGNPELEPTANTEFDMAFRYQHGRWEIGAKAFYSHLKNYIYQEVNAAGYQSYTNIDAHLQGADVKAGVDLAGGFALEGGLAYQRGVKDSFPDNNNDRDLGQIAPLKGRLALNYHKEKPFGQAGGGLFGTVEWIHSNTNRHIDADAGEKELASYDILNLRMGYRYKSLALDVGAENVFNRTYAVANSYEWDVIGGTGANPAIVNEPGRFVYASLAVSW